MQLNLTIDTDKASDIARAQQMLALFAPAAPAPAAPASSPSAAGTVQHAGMPPLPPGAPAGSTWSPSVGVPMLVGPDGHTIGVDWSDPHAPKIAPPPVYTAEQLAAQEAARQAGQALMQVEGLGG